MSDHENHEMLDSDCPECVVELDELARLFGPPPRGYTNEETAEMNADRELVLDETGGRGFE